MIVCDVSGNFMNSTDNGERLRCHFEGKQYQGWKLIRDKLKELKKQNPPPKGQSRYGAYQYRWGRWGRLGLCMKCHLPGTQDLHTQH